MQEGRVKVTRESLEEENEEGGPLRRRDGQTEAAGSPAERRASQSIWDPFVTQSPLEWFMASLEPPWWSYGFIIHS